MEVVLTLPLGQPHISHVKAGETITNTYNDWNLPIMQTVEGNNPDTDETRTDTRSFTYDNLGRKISATNESGTAIYEYDDFGRLTKETDVTGAVKEYTYDENGNRLTFTLTIDGTRQMNAVYTYDKLNQLTGVTVGGDTTTYGYDENGNIVNKTTGALVTTYSYNNGNMLTNMETRRGSSSINTYAANYFLDGNLKQKTGSNATTNYQYNNRNQLVKEEGLNGILNTNSYQYDSYGNIVMREEEEDGQIFVYQYEYNENNQLLQEKFYEGNNVETDRAYIHSNTYDENGNQRYRVVQTISPYADSTPEGMNISLIGDSNEKYGDYGNNTTVEEFIYNGFGERTGAIVDGTIAAYAYNPDGLRISKTVNGETTTHILDGSNVVADVKDGAVSKYNRGRGLISIEQNGNKGYYTFNGHGDVIGIVDANGSMKNQTWFYAYGYEIYQTDTVFDNPFGYAGEYTDEETGNIYLRARYYDPSTGRFTSEDPIKDGTNWYAYCGNNPIMFVDPWGLAVTVEHFADNEVRNDIDKETLKNQPLDADFFQDYLFQMLNMISKDVLRMKKDGTVFIKTLSDEPDEFTLMIRDLIQSEELVVIRHTRSSSAAYAKDNTMAKRHDIAGYGGNYILILMNPYIKESNLRFLMETADGTLIEEPEIGITTMEHELNHAWDFANNNGYSIPAKKQPIPSIYGETAKEEELDATGIEYGPNGLIPRGHSENAFRKKLGLNKRIRYKPVVE